MKTKRRHELQTNQLADWLGNKIEAVRPYTQYLVGGLIAIAVLICFVVYQAARHKAGKAQAWKEYMAALNERSPDALEQVAKSFHQSPAALWALQAAADIHLDEGIRLLYSDREAATETLERAKKDYHSVVERAGERDLLLGRAQFGLAQTYESLGELGQAKQLFGTVANAWPSTTLGQLASKNVERLEDPATPEFYDRFAEYKPPAPATDTDSTTHDLKDSLLQFPELMDRPDSPAPGSGSVGTSSPPTDEQPKEPQPND